MRSLKDTTNQYLIGPLASGVDMQLLGKRVIIDSAVPAVGAAAKSVIFGDVSAYAVRLAGGVRFERSDDFKFDTDIVSYRAILRADGATVDLTGALKHYASA